MESEQIVAGIGQQAIYPNEPLLLDPPTIRVLNIIPTSSHDSPIQLTLQHIPLTDDHICLSYIWGDSKDHEVIYINSKRFEVGRNLYEFLHLARKLSIPDPLWIDAICINQGNVQERNKQVQLMGDVYERASQVLIYPGRLPRGLRDLSPWKRNPYVGSSIATAHDDLTRRQARIIAARDRDHALLATHLDRPGDSSRTKSVRSHWRGVYRMACIQQALFQLRIYREARNIRITIQKVETEG